MRVVICGGPKTGKTTLAGELADGDTVTHTDDLIGSLEWSALSQYVADAFMVPGPWIWEGVATVRALRKALKDCPDRKPCDRAIFLSTPISRVPVTTRQAAMGLGCRKVWREIRPKLVALGVEITE